MRFCSLCLCQNRNMAARTARTVGVRSPPDYGARVPSRAHRLDAMALDLGREPVRPAPYPRAADFDAAFVEQFLNMAKQQREAVQSITARQITSGLVLK